MPSLPLSLSPMNRRAALTSIGALLASAALPRLAMGQSGTTGTEAPASPFSFDWLTDQMRARAAVPDAEPPPLTDFLASLDYDNYQKIQFLPERARWNFEGSEFRINAFHMGWLFKEPVHVFEVVDGKATEMAFSTADFEYRNDLGARVPKDFVMPGVAGIRLNFPLNRLDKFDEVVAFVGASYFRALGQDNYYGLSARGLAINTGLASAEEFPRFTAFYLERPAPGARAVTMYATLDSASVTGAYRFVITPGVETVMDITARLFFRADIEQLGVAPLTSMFLFSGVNRDKFDDYRPEVHDSDGLRIVREDGDVMWRQLNNPIRLGSSYFELERPESFGLYQRERAFDSYQDAEAHYERRPSLNVEPLGDWGKGAVRLVEIPSDLEVHDNIVAFWVPDGQIKAGESREFAYRVRWGYLNPPPTEDRALVAGTRLGHGGVAGLSEKADTRKFVVDFQGGLLGRLAPDDKAIKPVVDIQNGTAEVVTLSKIDGSDIWRLVIDVSADDGAVVELSAHVAGYGRKLSEIWLFQWMKS